MIGGKEVVIRHATVRAMVDAVTAKLPYPPPQLLTQLGLAVQP